MFECLACLCIYTTIIAQYHTSADLNKPVGWFMWTLKTFQLGYTGTDALRPSAKIHGNGTKVVLDDTI